MQPHVTVLTLAVPLAAVSALLALASFRQTYRLYRLQDAGRLGRASVWPFFSELLSFGNGLILLCGLGVVALCIHFGLSPDMVVDPQACPPQPAHGPWYPCDASWATASAVFEVQLMWLLLVVAPICWVLSVVMLIAGGRAGGRSGPNGRRDAARSE